MKLQGASALVTGAGRGIGRAVAIALAREGLSVTLTARTRADLDAGVAAIESTGGRATAYSADIRERQACERAVGHAVSSFGGLQVLVNNAGIGGHSTVAETDDEEWHSIIGTNLTAAFFMTRAALPHLVRDGGHIFMISSLAGTNPIAGMAPYCASKAALNHFAACLMLEVRHQGVKVTTIAPGSVDTDFGGKDGQPQSDNSWMLRAEDVAQTVVDLLRTRDEAHLSRIEMRPLRPPKR